MATVSGLASVAPSSPAAAHVIVSGSTTTTSPKYVTKRRLDFGTVASASCG